MESFGSWSILTTNFVIILFMCLGGVLLPSILHLLDGEWRYQIRHYSCAFVSLLPLAFLLLLILLFNGEMTFLWLAKENTHGYSLVEWLLDSNIDHWNHYGLLVARQIIGFVVIALLSYRFVRLQKVLDNSNSYTDIRRYRNNSISILFAYVLYGTMVAWDFEMTMVEEWHSAIYGAYYFVSNFHAFLAVFVIVLFFHRGSKNLRPFEDKVFNSLAQLLLGFTILWVYFFFAQYIIMWYGRLPYEINRINDMMYGGFGNLWWTFFAFKVVIPFTLLAIFTQFRHKPILTAFVAIFIVIGTWIERYTWIAGSTGPDNFHQPMTAPFDVLVTVFVLIASFMLLRRGIQKCAMIQK